MTPALEVNFDGLVGPTHNYAGLSHGNLASTRSRGLVANPRAAALQGLAKMKALADLGVPQAVLPPHERPHLLTLRAFGFRGSDAAVLAAAFRQAPGLLASCASASGMWVANAATVTPSADTPDGRVHFTPANLASKLHRAIETAQTTRTLRAIFPADRHFVVHDPVPGAAGCGDEGAANHTRFTASQGSRGLHLFAFGHHALGADLGADKPARFPSRQAAEVSATIARRHGLPARMTVWARQSPAAIDAGVFHNDVISTGHENLFLCHEQAFHNFAQVVVDLERGFRRLNRGSRLAIVRVPADRVSLTDAVESYLFNSQIVTVAPNHFAFIAPVQCRESSRVHHFLEELLANGKTSLREVRYFNLKESMRNGGGPACLRLRVVLTAAERAALPPQVWLTGATHAALVHWVKKHYRDELRPADLADPALLEEGRRALDELTRLLDLGPIYPFQAASA